jgi:hypothetical protein
MNCILETDLIRDRALARLEELCSYLLPGGHKEGNRWLAGSASGEPGRSFDVNLATGVFGDWATDDRMHSGAIDLWMAVRGVDFLTARRELAAWLAIPIVTDTKAFTAKPKSRLGAHRPIMLPKLDVPSKKDLLRLSQSRSIDLDALQLASNRGFLWCFDDQLNGRCWIITDERRRCAIRRRLDNHPFRLTNGSQTKAAACPGSEMSPIGYIEALDYPCIAITEGGPDALSALAYACIDGVHNRVAVICMPCTSARFTPTSLAFLKHKRARIFVHDNDAGHKAAEAWAIQLKLARLTVDGFLFHGLVQNDGSPVADLNDLLRIDADCWEHNRERVDSVLSFALEGKVAW